MTAVSGLGFVAALLNPVSRQAVWHLIYISRGYDRTMWPNQDETIKLVDGAERGDAEAVNRVLDRHRDCVHRMVACRLNPGVAGRLDASDVVQDALLTASKRLAEYLKNPAIPFHAWLRQLARDRLADADRREV